MIDNFEKMFSERAFFRLVVRKFATPSAVFNETLPVNPSVTITFDLEDVIWFPSMYPLNTKSPIPSKILSFEEAFLRISVPF